MAGRPAKDTFLWIVLFLQMCLTSSYYNETEEVQRIDMINISAFVTDFSDERIMENVSKVYYEEMDGDNSTIIENIKSRTEEFLVKNYYLTAVVKNLDTLHEYAVDEVHSTEDEISRISVEDPLENATSTCILQTTGYGHATTGVRCKTSRNLPEDCFCWDGLCKHPYLPYYSVVNRLLKQKVNLQTNHPGYFSWEVDSNDIKINATFHIVNDRFLSPLEIYVSSVGYLLGSKREVAHLKYSIIQFEPSDPYSLREQIQPSGPNMFDLQPLPGIFCPRSSLIPSQVFPEFPNKFSVEIETIEKKTDQVFYSQYYYDLKHQLVSMKYSPHPSSTPSVFLTTLSLTPHLLPHTINIIHNFNTGLQFTVSEMTGNCSVQPISSEYGDVAMIDKQHLRIKLAKELLDINPKKFVYSGKRFIRGILADVWSAEKLSEEVDGPYSTIELFFSDSDYNLQGGTSYELQNVPLGMTTYHAQHKNAPYFTFEKTSHFIQFSAAQPHWKLFDISGCVSPNDRLFLKVTLQVTYRKLVKHGLPATEDSIIACLAKEAGVSPLRVINIFLSSHSGISSVDVWFVLLERPEISSKTDDQSLYIKEEPTLKNAFMRLVGRFANPRKLKLYIEKKKPIMVTSLGGSLETVHKDDHLSTQDHSRYFMKNSYTVSSMASLGLSMAGLGGFIGLLVSFLLWKRQFSVTCFSIGGDTAPLLGGDMAAITANNQSCSHNQIIETTPSYHQQRDQEERY